MIRTYPAIVTAVLIASAFTAAAVAIQSLQYAWWLSPDRDGGSSPGLFVHLLGGGSEFGADLLIVAQLVTGVIAVGIARSARASIHRVVAVTVAAVVIAMSVALFVVTAVATGPLGLNDFTVSAAVFFAYAKVVAGWLTIVAILPVLRLGWAGTSGEGLAQPAG